MRELRPGLWHWEAPHPEWRATEPWSENVSSYAIDDGERLLLFDPLGVPSDLAADRETAIVLTAPWHERDAESLVERLGAPVYTPLPDSAQCLEINERWLRPGVTRDEIAAGLRPLLELPVEHVLATHGGPTDRAALERALSPS